MQGYALEKSGTLPLDAISRLDLPSGHPLAGRTPQVVFAIAKEAGIEPEAVTAANLADIDLTGIIGTLNLVSEEITSIDSRDDFNGLSGLTTGLSLNNNRLTESSGWRIPRANSTGSALPKIITGWRIFLWTLLKIYHELMRTLRLNENPFDTLPDDVFEGLTLTETVYPARGPAPSYIIGKG